MSSTNCYDDYSDLDELLNSDEDDDEDDYPQRKSVPSPVFSRSALSPTIYRSVPSTSISKTVLSPVGRTSKSSLSPEVRRPVLSPTFSRSVLDSEISRPVPDFKPFQVIMAYSIVLGVCAS